MTRRLLLGSPLESELLELLTPLEMLEEGLQALLRAPVRRPPQGLRPAPLLSRSELLELLGKIIRVLLRLRIVFLRTRCPSRLSRPPLSLPTAGVPPLPHVGVSVDVFAQVVLSPFVTAALVRLAALTLTDRPLLLRLLMSRLGVFLHLLVTPSSSSCATAPRGWFLQYRTNRLLCMWNPKL